MIKMNLIVMVDSGYSPLTPQGPDREEELVLEESMEKTKKWIVASDFRWNADGCGYSFYKHQHWEWEKRNKLLLQALKEEEVKTAKSSTFQGEGGDKKVSSAGMIVEDAERLKLWLTAILQPLCDADPAALAKYVLALIKKDKPEKELRQSMSDQLDVFLQHETKTFVDRLFELLRSKEYLTKTPPPIIPKESTTYDLLSTSSSSQETVSSALSTKDLQVEDMDAITLVDTSDVDPLGISVTLTDNKVEVSDSKNNSSNASAVKKDKKDDDRDRNRRSRRSRSRSPARRSSRLARSRSRTRDRKYHPRKNWRSSRRSRSRSPLRNRSISAGRNRSRSPPRYRRHGSRSRSRSPKDARGRSRSPGSLRDKGDKKDSFLSPNMTERLGDGGQKDGEKPMLQSVVVKAGQNLDKPEKGNRCRDFDEKGLCMRGELCPFDHGNDPVVLEDVVIPGVTTAPGQINYNHPLPPDAYGAAASMMRPALPPVMGEYYPDNPAMDPNAQWGGPFRPRGMGYDPLLRGRGGMLPRPMGPFPPPAHRDLISVPVMGMQPNMDPHGHPMLGMHPHAGRGMHMGRGRGRGGFDHSRLGFKPARNYANCSLEVKKIPREQNNIMDLNSHFQKFGKIVNIQINFETDPEAALVTFSVPMEAQAAYRSTEAVLNNRFIRVFWHSKEKENEEASSEEPSRVSVKDRLGGHEVEEKQETQEKILVSGNNLTKTVYNPSLLAKKTEAAAEKIQAVEAIKKSQEMLAAQETLKKMQEEKKKEALKLFSDLRKRKQEMLDEQIQQQKKLISKLESGKNTMKQEEKDGLMTLIKSIAVAIEKVKKDLDDGTPTPLQVAPKSKEEAQREMLDAELELYNKEQEGGDTMALQKKISDLRARAKALGVPFRGRGGFRGGSSRGFTARGRGGSRQALRSLRTVDRRPTRVRVIGFPIARLPEILPHFSQFGTIVEYETDPATPSMIVNFETRKNAEMAITNGKMFGDTELDITWIGTGSSESSSQEGSQGPTNNGDAMHQEPMENGGSMMEDDELGDILANEILLTYEEDEDDEETTRSWRR